MSEQIGEVNYTISENIKEDIDEVQYVYDDEEFILDPLGETTDGNDVKDFYFPDGTRAILLNGQYYVPADGQAIVLQDGEENLNSYIINQDCDSVIVGDNQDATDQAESSEFIQYIESPATEGQQIIYYTSTGDDMAINLDDYEGADTSVEQQDQLQELQEFQGVEAAYAEVEPVAMQQVVDLEDLVEEQSGDNGIILKLLDDMPQDDGRQCWYAVLKDGRLHIQTYTPETGQAEDPETNDLIASAGITKEEDSVDLSQITGRNLITGQTVTLHEYMAKLQRKLSKASEETAAVASVVTPVTDAPSTTQYVTEVTPKATRQQRTAGAEKPLTHNTVLKSLLHKTIPIGKTTNGKKVVGRIVKVQMRESAESVHQKIISKLQNVQSALQGLQKEEHSYVTQLQSLSGFAGNGEVETLTSEDVSTAEVEGSMQSIADDAVYTLENDDSTMTVMKIVDGSPAVDDARQTDADMVEITPVPQEQEEAALQQPRGFGAKTDTITLAPNVTIDASLVRPIVTDPHDGAKPVKIIVKSHQISKECYEDICKTLCGLMEMATIQKKLAKKNLAVKVVEKKFNSKEGKMMKNALHIYGYMEVEREAVGDGGSGAVIEKWKFVPDKNTQNALLADDVVSDSDQQTEGKYCSKYVETVPVTLLMTHERGGKRSVRVVLNPTAGNRCPICTREFATAAQARQHAARQHNADGSRTRCHHCGVQLGDAAALERHRDAHVRRGQLLRCPFCPEALATAARLLRHVSRHVPLARPLECSVCGRRCGSEPALRRHLLLHAGALRPHECDACRARLQSRADLTAHRRAAHGPVKLFVCLVCSRRFTRFSNLVRHNEIHKRTGNSLYTCEICGASYCFSSSLTRHMVQNHINANKS